ncbi:hypothetical protein ACFE04_002314 [Oxalis oulophora]
METPVRQWNVHLINNIFKSDVALAIKSIPLVQGDVKDQWVWNEISSGVYSVKSGYQIACKILYHSATKLASMAQFSKPLGSFKKSASYHLPEIGSIVETSRNCKGEIIKACCGLSGLVESILHAETEAVWQAVSLAPSDLPLLNSFIHYNYNMSSGSLQIAYRQTGIMSGKWVAWAINPTSVGMVGSQALIAYKNSNGSMIVYTSPITQYQTGLLPGKLSFDVSDLSAELEKDGIIIYATLGIKGNVTSLHQVWNEGPVVDDSPKMHAVSGPNVKSMATLDLLSGEIVTPSGGDDRARMKHVHGSLNVASWGILMPIGVMVARYLKVIKPSTPLWFYMHVTCQSCAYIISVAGWVTGIILGRDSAMHGPHGKIGTALFAMGTLQVFALLLRPKPDAMCRFYWNIYHHSIGYLVIILSIANIMKGLKMLNPGEIYENAYMGGMAALATIALCLQIYKWSAESNKNSNGVHGVDD